MSLDWYPFYIVDYRRDTRHLTLAEHGAYRALIDEYMTTKSPLPDNDRALSAIIGCGESQWLLVSATVRAYFEVSHGKLIHGRCEKELKVQQRLSSAKAEAGRRGGLARVKNINGLKAVLEPSLSCAQANSSTRQDTKSLSTDRASAGDLATALPTGALRSPATPVSSELSKVIRQKGWSP